VRGERHVLSRSHATVGESVCSRRQGKPDWAIQANPDAEFRVIEHGAVSIQVEVAGRQPGCFQTAW